MPIAKIYHTELGIGAVLSDKGGICRVILPGALTDKDIASLCLINGWSAGSSALLLEASGLIESYFEGENVTFNLPFSIPESSPFTASVLKVVSETKRGSILTYHEVAIKAGFPKASRGVGRVMANNLLPLFIPCHRVISSNGTIGGFSAGAGVSLKEKMLRIEGVAFLDNGRVRL